MRGYFNIPYQDDSTYTYPPIPTPTLVAVGNGTSEIDLTAFLGSTVTNWIFERGPSGSGPWTVIAVQNSPIFADTGLPSGTTFFYRVKALLPSGYTTSYSPVQSANTGSSSTIKYNPGHYMNSGQRTGSTNSQLANKNIEIDALKSGPGTGWMGKYEWCALQGSVSNQYNFSFIDTDYTRLTGISSPSSTPTGKRMIVQIMIDIFSSNPANVAPAFILNDPVTYGPGKNGTQGGYWTFNGGAACVMCMWRTNVMNAFINLYQAFASHVLPSGNTVDQDPWIEQMMSFEIASPIGADAGSGYSTSAYQTQLHNFVLSLNGFFPHTAGIFECNFADDPATTKTFIQFLQANRWGIGGPDTWAYSYITGQSPYGGTINSLTWGQQVFTGVSTTTYPGPNADLRGTMIMSQEVEDEEIAFTDQFQFAPAMPQDIMDTVNKVFSKPANAGGCSHFLWQYIGGNAPPVFNPTTWRNVGTTPGNWLGNIVPIINSNPIPYTARPTNIQ